MSKISQGRSIKTNQAFGKMAQKIQKTPSFIDVDELIKKEPIDDLIPKFSQFSVSKLNFFEISQKCSYFIWGGLDKRSDFSKKCFRN
mgnify:CR=1 FL=1